MAATAEQALRARITGSTAITDVISTRLYPQYAVQDGALPYGTYQRVSTIRDYHLTAAAGFATARVQIDWFADTYTQLETLAELVRLRLDGFAGDVTISTGVTLSIGSCHLEGDDDGFVTPGDASDVGIHRKRQDWMLTFYETAPSF